MTKEAVLWKSGPLIGRRIIQKLQGHLLGTQKTGLLHKWRLSWAGISQMRQILGSLFFSASVVWSLYYLMTDFWFESVVDTGWCPNWHLFCLFTVSKFSFEELLLSLGRCSRCCPCSLSSPIVYTLRFWLLLLNITFGLTSNCQLLNFLFWKFSLISRDLFETQATIEN